MHKKHTRRKSGMGHPELSIACEGELGKLKGVHRVLSQENEIMSTYVSPRYDM